MRALSFACVALSIGLVAGCSSDPCAGRSGTCIALTVQGAAAGADALAVTVDKPTTKTETTPAQSSLSLPMTLGLNLPSSVDGVVHIGVAAVAHGVAIAHGSGTATVAHDRGVIVITLGGGGANDLGGSGGDGGGDGVPGAPSSVVASSGIAEATITWSAPADSGSSPITSYSVVASPGGKSATTSSTTVTFSGLTNGTTYTFAVSAINAAGSGPAAVSNAVTPTATPMPPSPPTSVAAVANVDHGATITWTASDDHGSAITGYTITATQLAGSLATPAPTATSAQVTGLTPGTQYTFVITATNAIGTSAASLPSSPIVAATLPGAPTAVGAVTNVNQGATVSWTAPASNGYGAIVKYTVTASPGGATASTPDGNTLNAVINGLQPGTSYTFTVVAINAVGSGPASSASSAIVGCGGTAESCFNGIDDDCDGLIDCADSDCGASVATCVPAVAGASYGTLITGSSCPTHTSAQPYYNNFNNGTSSCECPAAVIGTCTATYYSNTDNSPSDTCSSGTQQSGNATAYSTTCVNVPLNIAYSVGNFGGCSCPAPSGQPTLTPASDHYTSENFCQASAVGGGCGGGQVCVPAVGAGNQACVSVAAGGSCDANYPNGTTWNTSYSDMRSCAACSTQATPKPYVIFWVYDTPGCTGGGSGYYDQGFPYWNECTPAAYKETTGSIQSDQNTQGPIGCTVYPTTSGSVSAAGVAKQVCCQ
jgi:hypothetical protein